MNPHHITSFLVANPDAVTSSAAGAVASAVVAVGHGPAVLPPLVQWALALVVSTAPLLLTRAIAAWAAGRDTLAVQRERRAQLMLDDELASNDEAAGAMLDDAARLRSQAAAARAFGGAAAAPSGRLPARRGDS